MLKFWKKRLKLKVRCCGGGGGQQEDCGGENWEKEKSRLEGRKKGGREESESLARGKTLCVQFVDSLLPRDSPANPKTIPYPQLTHDGPLSHRTIFARVSLGVAVTIIRKHLIQFDLELPIPDASFLCDMIPR